VLGIDIPEGRVREVLTALGFGVELAPAETYRVTVPYWRTDVRIADDIAEEVIRVVGYDDLPNTTIAGRVPRPIDQPLRDLRERAKDLLVAAGMQEVMTYSLVTLEQLKRVVPPEDLAVSPPLRVTNPVSATHQYLRTSLRGSLLETAQRNLRRPDRADVTIFETARTYQRVDGDLPEEEETVLGIVAGRRPDRWGAPSDEPVDFFDAKGSLEALLDGLHVRASFAPRDEFGFVSGRCAVITAEGVEVGLLGQVHPAVLREFDIERDTFLFEVRLGALLPFVGKRLGYRDLSRYESVRRDLALIVEEETTAAALAETIARTPLVAGVRVFDEYRGGALPLGKKSLAFALTFQAPDRTLTDAEVDRAIERLLRQLERQFGAARR
jgi:phenylalanyl-tRNA synthetase beta chain